MSKDGDLTQTPLNIHLAVIGTAGFCAFCLRNSRKTETKGHAAAFDTHPYVPHAARVNVINLIWQTALSNRHGCLGAYSLCKVTTPQTINMTEELCLINTFLIPQQITNLLLGKIVSHFLIKLGQNHS